MRGVNKQTDLSLQKHHLNLNLNCRMTEGNIKLLENVPLNHAMKN